jgi:phosphoglycerol transferase MdoB-like AlkP superfamily enzyme
MLRNPSEDSLDRFGFKDQVSYDLKLKEFNAFRYTDYTFEKFIEAARKQPFFDETLFVFIGDHGSPGEVGAMFPTVWTDKRLTALHVPLLFYAPKWLSPQRKDMICSQVDVMPTIAGLCNVSYFNTALGRDLLQPGHQPYAFIFDPDFRKIGLLKGDFFYRAQLDQRNEELMPITANAVPPSGIPEEYRTLTKAIHQTAGYLLVNNKKRKRRY